MRISEITYLIVSIICSYFIGSVNFAKIIARYKGIDISKKGSGNLGGTNAGRVLGKKYGLLTILLDTLKVGLAVIITAYIGKYIIKVSALATLATVLVGLAANIGHCFSAFNKFKGGKAVAGSLGFFIVFMPVNAVMAVAVFIIVLYLTKYVSLSSICTLSSSVFFTLIPFNQDYGIIFNLDYYWFVLVVIAANSFLVIWRHQSNIKRLLAKKENKVKWI